ncbi:MAG: hypothetical protein DRH30_02545 [Deltaproteobacteria bacterium]|nr:MAG: hypothetical protein DRH30_02545 [Deltaproteobacteria bacterium]
MESTGKSCIDYKRFFDLSTDLCCIVGKTHFLEVNESWEKVLGYTREELLTTPWESFIHPGDSGSSIMAHRGELTPREDTTYTNRYLHKSGRTVWLEWSSAVCGVDDCIYAAARDVTHAHSMESQLKSTIRDLQRSNRDLEQFAYAASHDLQTPLRKVKNFALLLNSEFGHVFDELESNDRDLANKYMRFLVEGAEKSQELINGLLHFSRTGRTVLYNPLPVDDAVDDAVFILSEDIKQKVAIIHRETLPELDADKSLIVRVFQNLIGNAIKFRHSDRRPEVWISAHDDGSMWRFEVRDNGIGIDSRHHDRAFIIFQRIGNKKNGVGLGLALCKRIVERHGGRIWFTSELGKGTSFFFTLPKEPS